MTTITSPRPSNQYKSPPSSATPSTRSSLSVDRPHLPQTRRTRNALRDYYNLPDTASTTTRLASDASANLSAPPTPHTPLPTQLSIYDSPNFDAEEYVQALLRDESLVKIMKTESDLLSEVRGLDGERKALVYDNYSKLIDATATIGRVREVLGVDALNGETAKVEVGRSGVMEKKVEGRDLEALVAKVVEIAGKDKTHDVAGNGDINAEKRMKKRKQQETVRWVLGAPRRLEEAISAERREDAEKDWEEVESLLEQWKGVKGVKEVREKCENLLDGG